MSRRLARRFSLGLGNALLFLAIASAAVAIWALRTEGGASFALAQLAGRVPGELTFERVEGTLADGVTLHGVRYRNPAGVEVDVAKATVRVALTPLFERSVQVESLALDGLRVALPEPGEPSPLQVPTLRAPLTIDVTTLSVDALVVARAGRQTVVDSIRAGALAWHDTSVTVGELSASAPQWRFEGRLAATLDGDVPLGGALRWSVPGRELSGAADIDGTLAALSIEHELAGDIAVRSSGQFALLGRIDPLFTLTHRCERSCAGDALTVRDVQVEQAGTLDDYSFTAQARVGTEALPMSAVRAEGRGSLQALQLATLRLDGPAGRLRATGRVRFPPELEFDVSGTATDVTPQSFTDAVRGSVAAQFALKGTGPEALQLQLRELRGTLNGHALRGGAQVARRDGAWQLRQLDAQAGENRLRASGRIGAKAVEIDAQVDAPRLEQISETLSGSVVGKVFVRGTREAPVIDTDLRAAGVAIAGWTAGDATIAVQADADGRISGDVQFAELGRDGRPLGNAAVRLGGTLDAADLDVDWRWQDSAVDATLHVRRTPGGMVVTVRDATAALAAVGDWTLGARFDVTIDGPNVVVGAHAWRQGDAGLTIEQITVAPGRMTIGATLTDLPLEPVNDFLRAGLRVTGRADGRIDLRRERDVWRGTVDWRQRDTLLRYAADEGAQSLRLSTVTLQGRIDDSDGNLALTVRGEHGTVADASVAFRDVGGDATLDGEARAEMAELAWLGRLFPGSAEVAGAVSLDITATGPMRKPDLSGRVEWRDGALSLSDLGTQLTEIRIVGEGTSAEQVALSGSAIAGGGRIELRGTLTRPLSAARTLALEIDGREVKVAGADGYDVWISPDVRVTADTQAAKVDGRIVVPRARVRVKELPKGAVARSKDVRVAGREDEAAFELPLSGTVDLVLGDDVHVEALGLNSDVRGEVKATLAPGREPRFDGRLFLENGEFRAYGQDLQVDRGNLFYAGSITNPTLDVQATRRVERPDGTVVAGVRVTGPADDYRVEVYSEPALPPTEALSYLVLGRPSVDATGQDGETLSRTAFALGLSRSSPITTQIASGLGLDEFSVAGDNLDDAELVAGKQLNDDLYVRFTYGVFSELGALLLRYRLSQRLALEVGSADVQSVDLLYSLEK